MYTLVAFATFRSRSYRLSKSLKQHGLDSLQGPLLSPTFVPGFRAGMCSAGRVKDSWLLETKTAEDRLCKSQEDVDQSGQQSSDSSAKIQHSLMTATEIHANPDLEIVVDALGTFLYKFKGLPREHASLIAANASAFTGHVLTSLKGSLEDNGRDLFKNTVGSYLRKQNINEYVLFFESIGMNYDAARSLSRVKLPRLLAVGSLLESYGIERKALGSLFERNQFLTKCSPEDILAIIRYLQDVGIPKDDFPWLFTHVPEILSPTLERRWRPFMEVLGEFGVGNSAMRRLVKHNSSLMMKLPDVDFMKNLTFFQKNLNLEKSDITRILKSHPEALLLDFDKSIMSKVEFLKKHKVKEADICRIFARCTGLVGYSVESLDRKIEYLESIGVRKHGVKKILVAFPSILAHSVDNKMKPAVASLQNAGITGLFLGKLITARPAIFALDTKDKLPSILDSLKDLGPEGMVLVLSWGISEGIEALKDRINYLRRMGFDSQQLVKMISDDPRILKINKQGLILKMKYLTNVMGFSKESVVGNPTFLYSHLDRRIKVRYEVLSLLHDKGVLPKKPELTQIMYPSNKDFMARYVNPYAECMAIVKKHHQINHRSEQMEQEFLMRYADGDSQTQQKPSRVLYPGGYERNFHKREVERRS